MIRIQEVHRLQRRTEIMLAPRMEDSEFKVKVGDVFHLWCYACTPQKYKFFVVAYTEPRIRYMLINSEPAKFQQENPELMRHQVKLCANEHGFLNHDSFLDCSQMLGGLSVAELENGYSADVRIRIGTIAEMPRQSLKAIVADSHVLTDRDKRMLLEAW